MILCTPSSSWSPPPDRCSRSFYSGAQWKDTPFIIPGTNCSCLAHFLVLLLLSVPSTTTTTKGNIIAHLLVLLLLLQWIYYQQIVVYQERHNKRKSSDSVCICKLCNYLQLCTCMFPWSLSLPWFSPTLVVLGAMPRQRWEVRQKDRAKIRRMAIQRLWFDDVTSCRLVMNNWRSTSMDGIPVAGGTVHRQALAGNIVDRQIPQSDQSRPGIQLNPVDERKKQRSEWRRRRSRRRGRLRRGIHVK